MVLVEQAWGRGGDPFLTFQHPPTRSLIRMCSQERKARAVVRYSAASGVKPGNNVSALSIFRLNVSRLCLQGALLPPMLRNHAGGEAPASSAPASRALRPDISLAREGKKTISCSSERRRNSLSACLSEARR